MSIAFDTTPSPEDVEWAAARLAKSAPYLSDVYARRREQAIDVLIDLGVAIKFVTPSNADDARDLARARALFEMWLAGQP